MFSAWSITGGGRSPRLFGRVAGSPYENLSLLNDMLELKLRPEFKGERLKGTTIDFSADKPTSALQKSTPEFLNITYPSIDLLRVFEATQPDKSRPVVLLGGRGQGKSHLMAALWHAIKDPAAATKWLADWAATLSRPELKTLGFRTDFFVIAESLHQDSSYIESRRGPSCFHAYRATITPLAIRCPALAVLPFSGSSSCSPMPEALRADKRAWARRRLAVIFASTSGVY